MKCFKANTLVSLFVFGMLWSLPSHGQEIYGRVIGVTDGDTFTLMDKKKKNHKIRLAEIDAPEKGFPHSQKSKDILSRLIFTRNIKIVQKDIDKYGRIVAYVFIEKDNGKSLNINKTLIASGAAWVYTKYSDDPKLVELQKTAKEQELGLWALPEYKRLPPWEWRGTTKEERDKKIQERESQWADGLAKPLPTRGYSASPPAKDPECGSKAFCSEMSDCEEAKHYLDECGLTTIDGDGDGLPCEKLCQ